MLELHDLCIVYERAGNVEIVDADGRHGPGRLEEKSHMTPECYVSS